MESTTQVHTTAEVANQLVDFCRKGDYAGAHNTLFAENASSIEPEHAQGMTSVHGLADIKAKSEQWNQWVKEVHSASMSEPLVAGNFFTVSSEVEVTTQDGNRMNMSEVTIYEVKDGKIVKEQFFY